MTNIMTTTTIQQQQQQEQSTAEILENLGIDDRKSNQYCSGFKDIFDDDDDNNNNNNNSTNRRRNSMGRAAASAARSIRMTRTASIPRLFHKSLLHNSASSVSSWNGNGNGSSGAGVWGQESTSTLETLNASLVSLEEDQMAAHELLLELNQVIGKLATRKIKLQQRIDDCFELACARYEGHCRHGALLSMRKAYGIQTRLAYVAAVRFQLVEMHERIQLELQEQQTNHRMDLDVQELRRCIIAMLTQMNTAPCPVPPNDTLWSHLYKLLDLVEI